MLPWICATDARVDSPSPADSSSIEVGAPGRYRLLMPRRTEGQEARGARRANRVSAKAPARNSTRVRPALAQKYSAKDRSVAVATVRPTKPSASAAVAPIRAAPGRVDSGI